MGSSLAHGGSVLEPAGIGSVQHGGSFCFVFTQARPAALSNPENHAVKTNFIVLLKNLKNKYRIKL